MPLSTTVQIAHSLRRSVSIFCSIICLVDATDPCSKRIVGARKWALVPTTHDDDARESLFEATQVEALGKDHGSRHSDDVGIRRIFRVNLAHIVGTRIGTGIGSLESRSSGDRLDLPEA